MRMIYLNFYWFCKEFSRKSLKKWIFLGNTQKSQRIRVCFGTECYEISWINNKFPMQSLYLTQKFLFNGDTSGNQKCFWHFENKNNNMFYSVRVFLIKVMQTAILNVIAGTWLSIAHKQKSVNNKMPPSKLNQ